MKNFLMRFRDSLFVILSLIAVTRIGSYEAKKSGKQLIYLSSEVYFNSEYLEEHSITIGPTRQTVDVIIKVHKDLSCDPWIGVIIKSFKGNTYRTIFQYEFNLCNLLGKVVPSNFVLAWINNFWKYGDMPRSCPIKKGNYSWHNLRAEKLNLPNFLPNGKYQINTNTYFRQGSARDPIANVTIQVEYK